MCKKMFFLLSLVSLLGLAGTTAQAEPDVIPTDWPVAAQWHFDEGSGQTVSDASGNGWNGFLGDSASTTTYDPTWTADSNAGPYALDFEPVDGVIIPLLGGRHPAAGADGVMVDVWIKPESLSNYATVVSASDDSGTDRYAIWLFADGRVRFASAGTPITAPAGTIVTGQWYHLVGVYDDRGDALGYSELYIDGLKKASWYNHTGSLTNSSDNTELVIGWYYPNVTQYMYDGVIDELTISVPELPDLAIAWDPDPADEWVISGKDKDSATLIWSSGAYTATHDVYLGTSYNAVKDANTSSSEYEGNQTANSYSPGSLESYTPYYWRIDEVNDSNSDLWKGDIWSFNVVNMTRQDFGGGVGQTPYTLSKYGTGSAAVVESGALRLLNGINQRNVIAFDQNDVGGLYGRIVAEWDFSITEGGHGFGFALLNTAQYGTSGAGPNIDWEEPSLTSSFSVGFDINNPDEPRYSYADGKHHEVSLHLNGRERANVSSPFDFRTGTFEHARVEVDFVIGGANISVYINGLSVYTDYFMAGMTPYDSRAAFGGRTDTLLSTTAYLDNIEVAFEESRASAPGDPVLVQTFVQEHIYVDNWKSEEFFDFPDDGKDYGRIILRLTLDEPAGGSDPIDRMLNVHVWDDPNDDGTRYLINRISTPYGGAGWRWWFDVTDYQWLLRGNKKVSIRPGFDKGWLVTTDFYYYEGAGESEAYSAENLWVGTPDYGECDASSGLDCAGQGDPIDDFFTPLDVNIDPNADRTKLHFVVTGHGENGEPEGSAAEFLKRGRTIDVNNSSYYDIDIWRDDCYLNPLNQDPANWTRAREGWCPGDAVRPLDIDITDDVTPDTNAVIYYDADEYILFDANDYYLANGSRHSVESHIIYYRQNPNAWYPDPADGAENVADDAVLSWSAGAYAASHDVYLGTDYNDVNDANTSSSEYKGNQSPEINTAYDDPCSFGSNTTYYWRIDEVNAAHPDSPWKGNVWSFTTETGPDTDPPTPDPMTWATVPYATGSTSISMTATTASDLSGVEYYFEETSGNPGGSDSGWQDGTTYEDTGLNSGTQYTYRVKARDKSPNQNETAWSTSESATTDSGPVTLLEDGFEVDFSKWTDGGTTNWDRTTSQKHSGSYSAHAGSSDNDLISDNLNTTSYSSITIVFWYRDDDIDDSDNIYLQLYDGSSYDNKFELGNTSPEDTWHKYETTINNSGGDAQYFHSTFRIKFEGTSIDRRENLWIDDVLITAE